jgi:hypothetical protein
MQVDNILVFCQENKGIQHRRNSHEEGWKRTDSINIDSCVLKPSTSLSRSTSLDHSSRLNFRKSSNILIGTKGSNITVFRSYPSRLNPHIFSERTQHGLNLNWPFLLFGTLPPTPRRQVVDSTVSFHLHPFTPFREQRTPSETDGQEYIGGCCVDWQLGFSRLTRSREHANRLANSVLFASGVGYAVADSPSS